MTTIVIELSDDTARIAEAQARTRNESVSQYVSHMLHEVASAEVGLEAVIRRIMSRAPNTQGIQRPTKNLADLPVTKPASPGEWREFDAHWDAFEAKQKAMAMANESNVIPDANRANSGN